MTSSSRKLALAAANAEEELSNNANATVVVREYGEEASSMATLTHLDLSANKLGTTTTIYSY